AYKSDQPDEENPTWPGGRPSFRYKLKGKKLYDPRKDSTVAGGSGPHRWNDPATREWGNNAAVCRYNYQRGIYALEKVDEPDQLLLGRGLSEIEAPPERAMVWANLCDEDVALKSGGTEKRYTINGVIASDENFLDAEQKFAAAMGGIIMQPEGSIEVEPGHAKSVIADFTDDDILNLEAVTVEKFRSESDTEWCNMVVPRYVEPTQNWKMHGGPIRRVYADVLADGGLRQAPLSHELITSGTQSQRCAEIVRRMGRLFTTAQVTLPPRFIHIEEGDWVGWTSQRHFKGSRIVFRVERYNRNEKWHMALVLREINAGVFTFNPAIDELTDGAEATNQNEPPAVGQPGVSAWALSAGSVASANGTQPALVIEGAVDDDYASAVRFEYRKAADTEWVDAGSSARTAMRKVIAPVSPNTDYVVGVTYTVDGEASARRIYGPVKTGNLAIDFGDVTGTEALEQSIADALALAASRGKIWTTPSAPPTATSNIGDTWIAPDGVFYDRVPGSILLDGFIVVLDGHRPSIYWTRSANQPLESTIATANNAAAIADLTADRIEAYDDDNILDISEKRRFVLDDAQLEKSYQEIIAAASTLAVDYSDLTTARTAYLAFRNAMVPAWNNTSVDTPVSRGSLDAVINAYTAQIEILRKNIEVKTSTLADWAGVSGEGKPEDGATRNKPRGNYSPSTEYLTGDSVVWRVEDGGTGHNYTRIGAGPTTGVSPSDGASWALSVQRGEAGPQGDQGIQGPQGTQGDTGDTGAPGAQGPAGADGESLYTWIAYADSADGSTNFTTGTNTGQAFIGIANNNSSATEGTNPASYTWSLIKGDQGVQGDPGADGDPTYTWFAYADSADGTVNFTTGAPGTRTYLGLAANKSTITESTTPGDYAWSKIEGPQGPQGPQGVAGEPGADGTPRYSWIAYANSADGTVDFTNGNPGSRVYIGIATNKTSASESAIPSDYTWSKYVGDDGADGPQGAPGADGAEGPQGIQGPAGADGTPRYIWIAYANSDDGSVDFTNGTSSGHSYIGIAENKTSATESSTPGDYNWSLIKGPQGAQGTAGVDGIDGEDGKLVEYIFTRSITKPAVATGNGIPAGTYDDPEDAPGDMPLWIAKGKQELDGTLIGTWGDWVPYGDQDKIHIVPTLAAAEAAGALVGQRALLPDLTLYTRVSGTGILLGGKVIVLGGYRPVLRWTRSSEQPFLLAASTSTWDGITGAGKTQLVADVAAAIGGAQEALDALTDIDDDGIITVNEKITRLIPLDAELQGAYDTITSTSIAMGLSYASLTAARNAWLSVRNAISPAWNDTSQSSPVARSSLDSSLLTYKSEIEALRKAIETALKSYADDAQADADAAVLAAGQANTILADIASDGVLTPNEKPEVILKRDVILGEQTGITSEATSYGITTEKTAYTASISALTSYLATLTTPVLWSNLTGNTTIVGSTFRGKFADVYAARQALLNKINAMAKALADGAKDIADDASDAVGAGLNPDGTVREDKVNTAAIIAGAITSIVLASCTAATRFYDGPADEICNISAGTIPAETVGVRITANGDFKNLESGPIESHIRLYKIPAASVSAYETYRDANGGEMGSYAGAPLQSDMLNYASNVWDSFTLNYIITDAQTDDLFVCALTAVSNMNYQHSNVQMTAEIIKR
ncbi:MAG: phage tail protein, partial [Parasphingorhabdus sp.]